MIVVVAGGIGSGKSYVMNILESLGAKTLYADKLNRELLEEKEYIALLEKCFDGVVVNGRIDTKCLRNIIFNNEEARKKLNSLAHPRIFRMIEDRARAEAVVFVEIPLFEECVGMLKYDKLCAVRAPLEVRVERVMLRDNISRESALKIIEAQQKEEAIFDKADFIVDNSSNSQDIKSKVERIYEQCLIG